MESVSLRDLVQGSPSAAVFEERLQTRRLSFLESGQEDIALVSEVDLDNLELHEHGQLDSSCSGLLVVACLAPAVLVLQRNLRRLPTGKKTLGIPVFRRNGEALSLRLKMQSKNAVIEKKAQEYFCDVQSNGYSLFALELITELDLAAHEAALLESHVSLTYKASVSSSDFLIDLSLRHLVPPICSKLVSRFVCRCVSTCLFADLLGGIDAPKLSTRLFKSVSSHFIVCIGGKLGTDADLTNHLDFALGNFHLFEFPHLEIELHVGIVYKGVLSETPKAIHRIPFGPSRAEKIKNYYPDRLNGIVLFPKLAAGAEFKAFDELESSDFGGADGPKCASDGAKVKRAKKKLPRYFQKKRTSKQKRKMYFLGGTAGDLSGVTLTSAAQFEAFGFDYWFQSLNDRLYTETLNASIGYLDKVLVYWQGHTLTGAGNVFKATECLQTGSFIAGLALPPQSLSGDQLLAIRSMIAVDVLDSCCRRDVFNRRAPFLPSSFAPHFRPLLEAFEQGLIASTSGMTMGTRVEFRMRSETIPATEEQIEEMELAQTVRSWKWIQVLLKEIAETTPRFDDAFIGLDSFDYYRYIRNSVWALQCEQSLACAVFIRQYEWNLQPNVTLRPAGLPRSVVLWLLYKAIGVSHVCGNIKLGFKERRVHEMFLSAGYFRNCSEFGHPFAELGVCFKMPMESEFAGLMSLNMGALFGSKQFVRPSHVGVLPDFFCSLLAEGLSKEQVAACEHHYREILHFDVSGATLAQLQFQSLSNPFARGICDWSGVPNFNDPEVGKEPEFGDLVVELEELGTDRRGFLNFRFENGIGPGYGEEVSASLRRERQSLLKRCLSLIAVDISDMHGDSCFRREGSLSLNCDLSKKAQDEAFQFVLNHEFQGQKESVFLCSFWRKLIEHQRNTPTIQKSLEIVQCKDDMKAKLMFLLHDKGRFEDGKLHQWAKSAAITVFGAQQAQVGLTERNTIIWEIRFALADLLGVILSETEFAFPFFEKRRLRLDKIWTFPFEKRFEQPLSEKAQARGKNLKKKSKKSKKREMASFINDSDEEDDFEYEDRDDSFGDLEQDNEDNFYFDERDYVPMSKRQSIRNKKVN